MRRERDAAIQERDELHGERDELVRERNAAVAATEQLRASRASTRELENEVLRLRSACEAAERSLSEMPELQRAASQRDALCVELDVMRRRVAEVDELRARADRVHLVEKMNESLERQLVEANAELEQLRALGLAQPARRAPLDDGDPRSLDAAIRAIASAVGNQATVVADDLGFPIVGFGQYQEHLAALCGILGDLHERARGLLPLGLVRRITLETEHGVTVSACSGEDEDLNITLATLTAGPGLETSELRRALLEVTHALRAGEHRPNDRRES